MRAQRFTESFHFGVQALLLLLLLLLTTTMTITTIINYCKEKPIRLCARHCSACKRITAGAS